MNETGTNATVFFRFQGEFQCASPKFCIIQDWRCDGDVDCADGSDELHCNTTCSPDEFTCRNGECTSLLWRCDGDNDCTDGCVLLAVRVL